MRKISITFLLLLTACAHAAPATPPVGAQLMARCAAACDPGEPVKAMVTADQTTDLWICVCRTAGPAGTVASADSI